MRSHLGLAWFAFLFLIFEASFAAAEMLREVNEGGRIYYAGRQKFEKNIGKAIPNDVLLGYAKSAYDEMIDKWNKKFAKAKKVPKPPAMMEAFWTPATGYLIVASSGVWGDDKYGYDESAPQQVRELLVGTSKQIASERKQKEQRHRAKACAEVIAANIYYKMFPSEPAKPAPKNGIMVAYGRPGDEPASHQNACTGPYDEWGCREFLAYWGVPWLRREAPARPPSPSRPGRKRSGGSIIGGDGVGLEARDDGDEEANEEAASCPLQVDGTVIVANSTNTSSIPLMVTGASTGAYLHPTGGGMGINGTATSWPTGFSSSQPKNFTAVSDGRAQPT